MRTDSACCRLLVRIIAVVEDHLLNITEDVFHRVIIGTAFGQRNPPEVEFPHKAASLSAFAGMGSILIQDDPYLLRGIPPPDVPHEATATSR